MSVKGLTGLAGGMSNTRQPWTKEVEGQASGAWKPQLYVFCEVGQPGDRPSSLP